MAQETLIRLSLRLYAKEAIVAVMYKYSGEYTILQEVSGDDILLKAYPKNDEQSVPNDFIKSFNLDLIDQQVRYNVSKEFGYIRDLIVEEAFKPINKK